MSGAAPATHAGVAWPDEASVRAGAIAERAARQAYGKLLARIARRTGDIASAEDALGHAFAKALATWPRTGPPDAPEAWLTTVAMNAVRDGARRVETRATAVTTLQLLQEERAAAAEPLADERLGLILAASHPAIAVPVHAPLILQTVFGVSAKEMAPAFLMPAATLSQRLVRAKAKIKAAKIPFEPDPPDRAARLTRARDAIYALYTIATAAPPSAAAAARASDALHLAELVAQLSPHDGEGWGLAALIGFCEARAPARRTSEGAYVPLSQQDLSRWDEGLIATAEDWLGQAAALGSPGPYQLEAAIQSVHCDRRRTGSTEWSAIATFYDVLTQLTPSVGAMVAKAAAHAEAFGPAAGLAVLDAVPADAAESYQPYWAVRASLTERAGAPDARAYDRAIALAEDGAVRTHLAALRATRRDGSVQAPATLP